MCAHSSVNELYKINKKLYNNFMKAKMDLYDIVILH